MGYKYKLKEGNEWNPLSKWPRNMNCFCGSGAKHKKCCAPKVPIFCSKEDAKTFRTIMKDAGIS